MPNAGALLLCLRLRHPGLAIAALLGKLKLTDAQLARFLYHSIPRFGTFDEPTMVISRKRQSSKTGFGGRCLVIANLLMFSGIPKNGGIPNNSCRFAARGENSKC